MSFRHNMSFRHKRILFYGFAGSNIFFKEVLRLLVQDGHDPENLAVVTPNGQCRRLYDDILPSQNTFYLFERYTDVYRQVRAAPDFRALREPFPDNCFKVLAADKEGFRGLTSEKQIIHLETIYRIYSDVFSRFRPEYVVFPDIEVVDGYMLYNLAKARDVPIAYPFHLRNLGRSVLGSGIREEFPEYFGDETDAGRMQAARFRSQLRAGLPGATHFDPAWVGGQKHTMPRKHILSRFVRAAALRLGPERLYHGEDNFYQKTRIALLSLLEPWRRSKYRALVLPWFQIRSAAALPQNFCLFALQVTPESSINYLSPYYVDQVRAIDEIRLSLPPDTWLVVKEHPAIVGFRPLRFYRDLLKMPGVLLADAFLPMEALRSQATVIFTITGTVGLECLFSAKPCYMFGENFFSRYLPNKMNMPDLSKFFRSDLQKIMQERATLFDGDLTKMFSVSHSFILADPSANDHVMLHRNIEHFALALEEHFTRLDAWRRRL